MQNIPSEERHVWTQYSMLSRFFGERVGGVRFFEELDRAKADPTVNYDLLELMHACLALGFQGIHRTSAGGAAKLQMIQRNLYETLRRVKRPNPELSPRWQGQTLAAPSSRVQVPVWAVGSVVGVLLLGAYIVFRILLSDGSEAVAQALLAVHPTTEVGVQRRIFAPPPPPPPAPTQVVRIRNALGAAPHGPGRRATSSSSAWRISPCSTPPTPPSATSSSPSSIGSLACGEGGWVYQGRRTYRQRADQDGALSV